jgi:hypothetical protein
MSPNLVVNRNSDGTFDITLQNMKLHTSIAGKWLTKYLYRYMTEDRCKDVLRALRSENKSSVGILCGKFFQII